MGVMGDRRRKLRAVWMVCVPFVAADVNCPEGQAGEVDWGSALESWQFGDYEGRSN